MGRLQRDRRKRVLLALGMLMGVAAVAAFVRLSRSGPFTPPVSEQQARAEAYEIVKHLARLDGYPFDARYSEGARDQAVRLTGLTKDAYEYFAVVFPAARPQVLATFLKPADWKRNYGVPSYYPPDRRLRVATDDSPLWQSFGRIVHLASPFGAYPRLKRTYGDGYGNLQLRRFFDLFTVHELAHAFELQSGVVLPTLWLKELFANLALYTFVATKRPSELANLTTFPDALTRVGAFNVMIRLRGYTSLDDFDLHSPTGNARAPMSNENAVWYQMRLLLLARRLFDHDGERALERLWAFGLKQAGRVQRPEDYYKEHGTLEGWSAAMHAADLGPELGAEVSSSLARAIADWPRTQSAGAVILGKTNVPANLQGYQVQGDIYAEGKNPHRLECSPGGSTGGGAAAVAAGLTALELGADGGGSLRVPAHFCGVFCLKPTDKTVPRYGGFPLPHGGRRFLVNMGQPGPLSRSIDDLELLWEIVRGPDPSDFEIPPIDWHRPSDRSLEQLRVAWTDGFEQYVAGAETREQLAALAARIEDAGARVEKAAPAIFPRAREVFVHLQGALLGQDMPWLVRKIFPIVVARGLLRGQPHMVRLLRRALKMNTREYAAALGAKRVWVEDIEGFFGSHDVLLAPVSYGPAFKRCKQGTPLDFDGAMGAYNDYCWPYVGPFNASGHPALAMPLGTSKDGLPIGVQLIGPCWSEPELLHIARQLAPLTKGFVAPQGF